GETGLVDLSIDGGSNSPVDITRYDGELVSKDVMINAAVKLPSGGTAQKTFILTMERAILKADREITGRWIIAAIKDAAAAGGKSPWYGFDELEGTSRSTSSGGTSSMNRDGSLACYSPNTRRRAAPVNTRRDRDLVIPT